MASVAGDVLKSVLATKVIGDFKDSYQRKMKDHSFLFNYLHPFLQVTAQKASQQSKMAPPQTPGKIDLTKIDKSDLWLANKNHEQWITELVRAILTSALMSANDDDVFRNLAPLCRLKVEVSEGAMPYVVHSLLQNDDTGIVKKCLSTHIQAFFQAYCDAISIRNNQIKEAPSLSKNLPAVFFPKKSVQVMLNVVQYLRKQNRKSVRGVGGGGGAGGKQAQANIQQTPWDNNFWLDLDYLPIARAAHFCKANFTALMFVEIWWEAAFKMQNSISLAKSQQTSSQSSQLSSQDSSGGLAGLGANNNSQGFQGFPSLDSLIDHPSPFSNSSLIIGVDGREVQALLLDIYSDVGDPDSLYGCGVGRKSDARSRVLTYLQELDQGKALTTLDIEASYGIAHSHPAPLSRSQSSSQSQLQSFTSGMAANQFKLFQTLQACGADSLLQRCFDGFDGSGFSLSLSHSHSGGFSDSAYMNNSIDKSNMNLINNTNVTMKYSSEYELEDFRYQAAWRLGQWDFAVPSTSSSSSSSSKENNALTIPFHKAVYNALYSLRKKQMQVAAWSIEAARKSCLLQFDITAEACQEFYPFVSNLQSLGILQQVVGRINSNNNMDNDDWRQIMPTTLTKSNNMASSSRDVTLSSLTKNENKTSNNSDCLLTQLELVSSLARVLQQAGVGQSSSIRLDALWNIAVTARQAKRFPIAEKFMRILKLEVEAERAEAGQGSLQLSPSSLSSSAYSRISVESVEMEEAKLFWARSEVKIALDIMKNLIDKMNRSSGTSGSGQEFRPLLTKALSLYGIWLAEMRSETPSVIMGSYLERSVYLMEDNVDKDMPLAVQCFLSLAQYADARYQQISDYWKSPVYKDKLSLLQEVKSLLHMTAELKRSSKYLKMMERNASIDEEEMKTMDKDHIQLLKQALVNYLRVLKLGQGDDLDLKVFRVVALWFENAEDDEVNKLIKNSSLDVASHKFLPLYYQLAARMNVDDDKCSSSIASSDSSSGDNVFDFDAILLNLMERVARDHPHHTLWIILALAHANKDDELLLHQAAAAGGRKSRLDGASATNTGQAVEEGRIRAAKQMLDRIKAGGTMNPLGEVVRKMEALSVAYLELANWDVTDFKNEQKPFPIDRKLQFTKLKDITGVLLPTAELKVDQTGNYSDVVYPSKFSPTMRLVGGVNLPKVISCTGSDGKERTQLVKGRDDLRQDAVMQQVFSLVNQVLREEPETRQRRLSIRTYKVVPLSQKSGLLEWCKGTQPLGEYLIGKRGMQGAHERYRPKDWKAVECRAHLMKASAERKLKAYKEVCAHFKPVFRHFFMEKFKDPPQWFEKRLTYTRSVATNSIVGYILGLGDRHVQNILVDLNTSELVHIDLGIAFEMGRILPTPETVPFRLTRDVVDGMGISGVEGVFRRCCEKTMHVLCQNAESLLTIVQVLLHDPLSHWSLSPQQVLAIQVRFGRNST